MFDTPGLPTTSRVTDNVKHPEYLKHILMTKEPSLSRIVLDQGGALWFGGLARLDLVSGPSVGVVVFMSNEVTIVRNTIQKANLNYLKGFGKELFPTYTDSPQDTAFTRHPLKIRLSLKGSMNHEEICIHGLGSFVFRQLEHTHVDGKVLELDLFLPPNVEFSVRPALLGIQEALTAKTTIRKAKRGNQSGIN